MRGTKTGKVQPSKKIDESTKKQPSPKKTKKHGERRKNLHLSPHLLDPKKLPPQNKVKKLHSRTRNLEASPKVNSVCISCLLYSITFVSSLKFKL
jgi:hypothetical protein